MKYLLFFFLILTSVSVAAQGKKTYLNKGADGGIWINGAHPGDTFVVRAAQNPYTYLYLGDQQGSAGKPIVVINEGGIVKLQSMSAKNSRYIKITGSGTRDRYGFYINQHTVKDNSASGISIEGKSSDIQVERFWIDSAGFGAWCKNEHFCDSTLSTWVLDHITINDFRMSNLWHHGFYFGATEIENTTRASSCNGQQVFLNPSRLGHIRIYNGVLRRLGKNGIMVSDARYGVSEIYNNDIDTTGLLGQQEQGTGIAIGGGTSAYVHDNKVNHTWLWGIASFGGAQVRIENNTVSNSGNNGQNTLPWPENIRMTVDPRFADSVQFTIRNNRVASPGRDALPIHVYGAPRYSSKSLVCNNTSGSKPAPMKIEALYKECVKK